MGNGGGGVPPSASGTPLSAAGTPLSTSGAPLSDSGAPLSDSGSASGIRPRASRPGCASRRGATSPASTSCTVGLPHAITAAAAPAHSREVSHRDDTRFMARSVPARDWEPKVWREGLGPRTAPSALATRGEGRSLRVPQLRQRASGQRRSRRDLRRRHRRAVYVHHACSCCRGSATAHGYGDCRGPRTSLHRDPSWPRT
jgi:hypothetical protein